MELVLIVIVLGILVASLAGIVVRRRPGRRPELEPPVDRTRPPAGRPQQPPRPAAPGDPATGTGTVEARPELTPEQVAEVEEALRIEEAEAVEAPPPSAPAPPEAPARPRFRDRLGKARSLLAGYAGSVLSRSSIDDETWDDLEEALIRADVGVTTSAALLDDLRARVKAEGITTPEALLDVLKESLKKRLSEGDRGLAFEPGEPNVWLFVGVNGVGKTTTIGKVGQTQAAGGRTVVMAAADTFRAAAAEQLGLWADRVGADLVRGAEGGDPGSVVFDAVQRAAARHADLVLADTAGRLHTKVNLMEELRKVRRIAERPPGRLTEVLLVLDATTGQNGLVQAKEFTAAVGCTGVVLTKLDGTAKGGIALAVQSDMGLPIKLVGLGEGPGDLVEFDPDEFVDALFG